MASSYQQAKKSFLQLFSEKHWKLSQELLWKWLKESSLQKNIRQFALALQSRFKADGKVWEAWQIDKRFYALVSIGNRWQVIRDDNASVCEGTVDSDRLVHLQFIRIGNKLHLFNVDQRGSIIYLVYSKSFELISALRYNHDGSKETIKEIIPIYTADQQHHISYLWAVFESRIILLHVQPSDGILKSVVYYSVPARSKLIQCEGRDTIHFHNGLLALHYSLTMKDLQLEILDSTPAILFNEKPHTERRRTFESLKFPLTVDTVFHNPYRSSNTSEEIMSSFISFVIPDTCPNYSSTGESISNLPFSINCYVAGSRNSISVLTYQSSEYSVKSTIIQLTGRHLLDFELMNRNDKLISIDPVQKIEYYSPDGHYHEKNLVDLLSREDLPPSQQRRKLTIWEACASLQLCIPVRRTWLSDLWKDSEYDLVTASQSPVDKSSIDQCILLEGVLGLGLTKVLQDAILKTTTSNQVDHHFYLEQSQRLFHWIGGQGLLRDGKLPSLRQHLHSLLFPLLTDRIFVYLMKKQYRQSLKEEMGQRGNVDYYSQIPLTVSLDVTHVSQLISTYSILSKALYERKLAFIADSLKLLDLSVLLSSTLLTDDLESNALIELMLIHYESVIFKELITFYQLLCEDSFFQLSFFNSIISEDSLRLQERVKKLLSRSVLVYDLPENELRGGSLFYEFIDRLVGESFEVKIKHWFEGLSQLSTTQSKTSQEVEQQLVMIFALPFLLFQHTSQKIVGDLLYYKKTLAEMEEYLDQQKIVAKYILLYLTFFIRSLALDQSLIGVSREETRFYTQLATVLNVSIKEVAVIDALQQIDSNDSNLNLSHAIQTLQLSSSVQFLTKYGLLEPVVKRLLFSGQLSVSYQFLQALVSQNHSFMRSKKGVVAYGLSIPSLSTWELHWQQTRTMCDQLSPADTLEGISQVTFYLCKWCIRVKSPNFQPLGSLLNKDLSFAESEQVIKFLFAFAHRDIEQRIAPSPAVDTLFGVFVKLMRFEEARALHDLHATTTKHADSVEALQSLTYRTKILQLAALCPRLSPIDYQLILNMNRINQIE